MEQIRGAYSKDELIALFHKLGIRPGMTLEVHAALSKFGYIIGGAETFVDALLELLGPEGTIVVPFQRGDAGDPAEFVNPPVVYELHEKLRKDAPAFDALTSDMYHMSVVYENLRRRKNVSISPHPTMGFAAIGKNARNICSAQPLDFPFGKGSPLEKLVDAGAYCLLAGVSYDNMTVLHYGESLSKIRPLIKNGAAVREGGKTVRKEFLLEDLDSSDGSFMEIGEKLEARGLVSVIKKDKLELRLLRADIAAKEAYSYYRKKMDPYLKRKLGE